jgi:hypothetical protein
MPDLPELMASQKGLHPHPTGVTAPIPVTTTRLLIKNTSIAPYRQ